MSIKTASCLGLFPAVNETHFICVEFSSDDSFIVICTFVVIIVIVVIVAMVQIVVSFVVFCMEMSYVARVFGGHPWVVVLVIDLVGKPTPILLQTTFNNIQIQKH